MAKRNLIDSIPLHFTYTLDADEKELIVPVLETKDGIKKYFTFNYWSEAPIEKVFYNSKTCSIRFIFDELSPPVGGEILSIVGWFYVSASSNSVE